MRDVKNSLWNFARERGARGKKKEGPTEWDLPRLSMKQKQTRTYQLNFSANWNCRAS